MSVRPEDIPEPGFAGPDDQMGWRCRCPRELMLLQEFCLYCQTERPDQLAPWVRLATTIHRYSTPAPPGSGRPHSEAYRAFIQSLELDLDQVRDGEGFALDQIPAMEEWELPQVVRMVAGRDPTWREVEVLGQIELPEARAALEELSRHRLSIDLRLAAASELHRLGLLNQPMDELLATELRNLHQLSDGCTRALLLAEEFPTEAVQQALLYASYNRTECAMHCAGVLCYLRGVGKEAFDWDLRPLFLRLDPHNSGLDRQAAFAELCRLVKMELG